MLLCVEGHYYEYITTCVVSAGLIRARLEGTGRAKGRVLAFLDSHCEVTVGWLEPLVATVIQVYTCAFGSVSLQQSCYISTGTVLPHRLSIL